MVVAVLVLEAVLAVDGKAHVSGTSGAAVQFSSELNLLFTINRGKCRNVGQRSERFLHSLESFKAYNRVEVSVGRQMVGSLFKPCSPP